MKITITLTMAEAKTALASLYGSQLNNNDIEVNILDHNAIVEKIRRFVDSVAADLPGNKISRIKALREVSGLGLGDAKMGIENWAQFLNYIEKYGKLPEDIYNKGITQ